MKTATLILIAGLTACVTTVPIEQTSDTAQAVTGGPFCEAIGCAVDWQCQVACDNDDAQCLIYAGPDGLEQGRCLNFTATP